MKKPAAVGSLLLLGIVAFAVGRYSSGPSHEAHASSKHVLYYVDPMHPAYRSDKPGIAPDCGMPLVPVYESEDPAAKLELPAGAVSISPEKQQLIGARVETVEENTRSMDPALGAGLDSRRRYRANPHPTSQEHG